MHPQSPKLRALAEKWANVPAGERANYQIYLADLADALGVARPQPRGSGYEFEYPLPTMDRNTGKEKKNFVDLYRVDYFVLEAKDKGGDGAGETALRKAYAQAKHYTVDLPHAPPPYLLVLDVGRTLLVWDRWSGTYGGFNLARRIDLRTVAERPEEIDFLRAVWENPASLDPRGRAAAVTREVAARLAELSSSLEDRGHDPEEVAKFLMRCVFTMFAEDVELLAGKPFQTALAEYREDPTEFAATMEELWRAMDEGRRFGLKKLLRFNGHFFRDASVLPLTNADLAVLWEAAKPDWKQVEPTIFGTLLTRALDPKERHKLGAEYTPREYVERVVRQTVDVPIRGWWAPVQAAVVQLLDDANAQLNQAEALRSRSGEKAVEVERQRSRQERERAFRKMRRVEQEAEKLRAEAVERLHEFHRRLRALRFLDPACGSGNFLYVTLHTVKRIELEVIRQIEAITKLPELGLDEVKPDQFHGIEIKPWAREIAELTLWIGYHQFWMEHHKDVKIPEPVLQDTGTLDLRDAVLAWDEKLEIPEKSRLDPTPRIPHPVTGRLVPDPNAELPYFELRGARQATWPEADFIVGNPPYLGHTAQRDAFGDGYVDALRAVYSELPDTADFVTYWWYRAAREVAAGRAVRAGLITTKAIAQSQNRPVIAKAEADGAVIVWVVPNHPWIDGAEGADVRVAMTVIARKPIQNATLLEVDYAGKIKREVTVARLNSDLSIHVDVGASATVPLQANSGLSYRGVVLLGSGFVLEPDEAERLLKVDPANADIIKPLRNGRDLSQSSRGVYVIDFGMRTEEEARNYVILYDLVRSRVKPQRDADRRETRRKYWWRFGEPQPSLRDATGALSRFIATPMTAKHRFFMFLPTGVTPDQGLIAFASADGLHLGVLSSTVHVEWALAAGGRLGVGNDPRYNNSLCFDSFPFPDPSPELRAKIADVAERLDQHRKDALARDERVTMTGMYNVVEKLRSGEALTAKERPIHEIAACGVLRDLHDELDRLVAEAYGWPWPMERDEILERLVGLHDERVEEEKHGRVRWLRPEYQVPRFAKGETPAAPVPELALPGAEEQTSPAANGKRSWPGSAIEQIAELKTLVSAAPTTAEEAAAAFGRAPVELVRRHLETLVLVGEVRQAEEGRFAVVAEPL